jgi:hypothetical protein
MGLRGVSRVRPTLGTLKRQGRTLGRQVEEGLISIGIIILS